jgi:hypothetical protein
MSIVGFTAKRIEPVRKSQSAGFVIDAKKKNALPMTKHSAAPKSTPVRTIWYRQ